MPHILHILSSTLTCHMSYVMYAYHLLSSRFIFISSIIYHLSPIILSSKIYHLSSKICMSASAWDLSLHSYFLHVSLYSIIYYCSIVYMYHMDTIIYAHYLYIYIPSSTSSCTALYIWYLLVISTIIRE